MSNDRETTHPAPIVYGRAAPTVPETEMPRSLRFYTEVLGLQKTFANGDARALYDRLVAHGVRIVKGLRDAPYGLRDFVFADPDGNRIDVGERL